MELRKLRIDDAARLLDFERDNRAWFERFVEARSDSFYSVAGVQTHIAECLDQSERGVLHPCLLVDRTGGIVGRANLRNIDHAAGSASIGYRIAQKDIGKGWAGGAVEFLKNVACAQLHLSKIIGYVSVDNPASAKVLEKSGFAKGRLFPDMAVLRSRTLDCHEYVYLTSRNETRPIHLLPKPLA